MKTQTKPISKVGENFGGWITLIIMSLFLLLDVTEFNSLTVKYSISSILGLIGALGLGFEIHDLTGKKLSIDNITVGLLFIALYVFSINFFKTDLSKVLSLILMFFGIFGIISGSINMLISLISNNNTKKRNLRNIILFILEIIGGASAILSIIQTISQLNL